MSLNKYTTSGKEEDSRASFKIRFYLDGIVDIEIEVEVVLSRDFPLRHFQQRFLQLRNLEVHQNIRQGR